MVIEIARSHPHDGITPTGGVGYVYTITEDGKRICRGFVSGDRARAEQRAAQIVKSRRDRFSDRNLDGTPKKRRGVGIRVKPKGKDA